MVVYLYLTYYEPSAYISLDTSSFRVNLHYMDNSRTDDEVHKIAAKLAAIRTSESWMDYNYNEKLQTLTFDIYWMIDGDGK